MKTSRMGGANSVRAASVVALGSFYLLGSYRIATAPEPNSSRFRIFESTPLELPNGLPQIPGHALRVPIDLAPVRAGDRHAASIIS